MPPFRHAHGRLPLSQRSSYGMSGSDQKGATDADRLHNLTLHTYHVSHQTSYENQNCTLCNYCHLHDNIVHRYHSHCTMLSLGPHIIKFLENHVTDKGTHNDDLHAIMTTPLESDCHAHHTNLTLHLSHHMYTLLATYTDRQEDLSGAIKNGDMQPHYTHMSHALALKGDIQKHMPPALHFLYCMHALLATYCYVYGSV